MLPEAERPLRASRALTFIALAAVLVAILGIVSRVRARTALKAETARTAAPTVSVIAPERGAPASELVLPGNVKAYTEAPIYARTSGYLKKWYVDIGARVRKGQVLADIESPEIDHQLSQARADLASAQANEHLAQSTADRYMELVKTDSVSRQDADNAVDGLAVRRAAVESARANVRRLEQMVSFEKVEAPFDGVLIARNTDVGQLIDSGGGGGPARELFRVAVTDPLRVFVNVPQTQSRAVPPGLPVDLTFAERPGRRFRGTIVRTANAIDPATRTLLVEIGLDNRQGEILPGAYADAHIRLAAEIPTLLVPVSALMFRSEGVRVAILTGGNRAHLMPVTLGRDYGTRVEVTSGLEAATPVIDSPPDSLVEGQEVTVAKPPAKNDAVK